MRQRLIVGVRPAEAVRLYTAASSLGRMLDLDVDAVWVWPPGVEPAQIQAPAGITVRHRRGDPVEVLLEEIEQPDVALGVLGLCKRIPGTVAGQVLCRARTPILVLPSDATIGELHRVLIPLDGSERATAAASRASELLVRVHPELIPLHVFEPSTRPRFFDRPEDDADAWASEFMAKQGWVETAEGLRLLRGNPEETIVEQASRLDVDAIALGWKQEMSPNRAAVVRLTLANAHCPVLLIPSTVRTAPAAAR